MEKICFEKPDLPSLTRNYTVVDLHFHTRYTDGLNTVAKIAQKARALKIGVAITDHNDIRGALEINRDKSILSIPGIEVTSKEGTHVLVYFYDIRCLRRYFKYDIEPFLGHDVMSSTSLEMEEIIIRARAYETVVIFPHPYCGVYTGIANYNFSPRRLSRLLKQVDGVEVINAENINKWNLKCALLGFNLDKAVTGGSDGHSLHQMGKVVTYAECKRDRRTFLDAIKSKQNKVIGKESHLFSKFGSSSVKLANIKTYPDLVEKNINYGCKVINMKSKLLKDRFKQRLHQTMQRYEKSHFVR